MQIRMPRDEEKHRQWCLANKERMKAQQRQWRESHKEHVKACAKKWREENKEEKKAYGKQYRQTDAGKKSKRIWNWKKQGILSDDYDALYDKFLNTKNCEECGVEMVFGRTKNARCLDHCHSSGLVRNVLCISCNSRRR
jgi:hypothetical protein